MSEETQSDATWIREAFATLGWSQREAAQQLGVLEGECRAWCRGAAVPRFAVLAIERLLEIQKGATKS